MSVTTMSCRAGSRNERSEDQAFKYNILLSTVLGGTISSALPPDRLFEIEDELLMVFKHRLNNTSLAVLRN